MGYVGAGFQPARKKATASGRYIIIPLLLWGVCEVDWVVFHMCVFVLHVWSILPPLPPLRAYSGSPPFPRERGINPSRPYEPLSAVCRLPSAACYFMSSIFFTDEYPSVVIRQKYTPLPTLRPEASSPFHTTLCLPAP